MLDLGWRHREWSLKHSQRATKKLVKRFTKTNRFPSGKVTSNASMEIHLSMTRDIGKPAKIKPSTLKRGARYSLVCRCRNSSYFAPVTRKKNTRRGPLQLQQVLTIGRIALTFALTLYRLALAAESVSALVIVLFG